MGDMSGMQKLLGMSSMFGSGFGSRKKRRGGDNFTTKCELKCEKFDITPVSSPKTINSATVSVEPIEPIVSTTPEQQGGKKKNKNVYKKYLENLSCEKVQKIARNKNIKITKKKDGKTTIVKKLTIIKKLMEDKYGK